MREAAVHACEMVRHTALSHGASPATAYMAAALLAWELEDPEKRPRWPRWSDRVHYQRIVDPVRLDGKPVV